MWNINDYHIVWRKTIVFYFTLGINLVIINSVIIIFVVDKPDIINFVCVNTLRCKNVTYDDFVTYKLCPIYCKLN